MAARFAKLWPKVAHGGEENSQTKKSVVALKLTNVALKCNTIAEVIYLLYAFCGGYMQRKPSKFTKNHQKHQKTPKPPAIPTNQLTCTTNMIFSHGYRVCKGESVKFNFALYLGNIHFSW